MTGFLIALVAVLLAALAIALAFILVRSLRVSPRGLGYKKVMVATVMRPFHEKAVTFAARMAGREGMVETVYVAEIPMNRPLESEAEAELSEGMVALEESAKISKKVGTRPIPRLERSRLGSKTIVELQRNEGFDAVVLSINPGKRSEREGRKIAEYVQEHAACTVVVVSELRE